MRVLSLWKGEILARRRPDAFMRDIASRVGRRRGVPLEAILGRSLARPVVHARQEAMYVIRYWGHFSYPAIGRFFGRDHATVINNVKAHGRRVEQMREAA
jgi:chromosomal replication initiator protein